MTTVGEVVDKRGPCALMVAVADLAQAHGRIPVGYWQIDLESPWSLTVNGTGETRDSLPAWNAMLSRHGWPVAMFDTADGVLMGGIPEDDCLRVLQNAIQNAPPRPLPRAEGV